MTIVRDFFILPYTETWFLEDFSIFFESSLNPVNKKIYRLVNFLLLFYFSNLRFCVKEIFIKISSLSQEKKDNQHDVQKLLLKVWEFDFGALLTVASAWQV